MFLPHIPCGPPSSVSCMVSCIANLFVPSSMVVGWFYTFSFLHNSVPAPVNGSVQYIPHLRYELLYKKLLYLLHRIMRESEISLACHISLTIPCQLSVAITTLDYNLSNESYHYPLLWGSALVVCHGLVHQHIWFRPLGIKRSYHSSLATMVGLFLFVAHEVMDQQSEE